VSVDLWARSAADAEARSAAALTARSPGSPPKEPPADRPGPTRAPRWSSRRRWLLIAGLAVIVVLVGLLFVTTGPGPSSTAALDPQNPTATGAQALARVLGTQDVRVDIVRSQAELARAGVDQDTTVLVARTSELAPTTSRELARLTAGAERLVVVSPSRAVLRELSPTTGVTTVRRAESELMATSCGDSDVRDGETLSRSDSEFQAPGALNACFTHGSSSVYETMPKTAQAAPLVLFGSTTAVTNDQITQAADAAILLRMLGHSARVVWYVPSRLDAPAQSTGTAALIPRWIGPGLALGAVAFAGVVLWRGRRFGRLVPEPLPVVVRAAETTQSRGRLYRRARDASRASIVLQQATRKRLADYLGMPRPTGSDAADHALVSAVATAAGRRLEDVGGLLYGPPPTRDDHLLGLAVELADLEKDVRRP